MTDVSPRSPTNPFEPTYLDDGLYASFDGYQIEVYAHNGYHKSASVFLEPAVYHALRAYGAKIWELAP